MSKTFTRIRRVVVPMLTALVILSQTAPASFAMSADDVASLAATNQQVEIIQNMPANNAAVNLSAAGASYTVLAVNDHSGDMDFADWAPGPWWYGRDSIKYAVDKGYIQGMVVDGKTVIGGSETVTEAMFATVLVRMAVSQSDQQKYIAQDRADWIEDQQTTDQFNGKAPRSETELGALYDAGKTGRNWATQTMYIAKQSGLLDGISASTDGAGVCARSTMARMLVNALNIRGEDTSQTNIQAAVDAMSDRYTIWSSGSAQEIGTAIALGLITGDNNKAFNPSGTMDRASMCEVLHRLDNPSGQREAVLKQSGLDGSSSSSSSSSGPNGNSNQTASTPITIDMRTPDVAHRAPKEGDTIIRPDGSEVVLARDPVTGVLGYGQNVGAYLGTQSVSNGALVKENTFGSGVGGGWDDILARGTYRGCDLPGYEYTYLWQYEWQAVQEKTYPGAAKGTEGQKDSTGLWEYKTVAGEGSWIWRGPSC